MNIYDLWLMDLDISNKNKIFLILKYKSSEKIYNDIDNIKELYKLKLTSKYKDLRKGSLLEEYLINNYISYVTILCENYPNKLRTLENPPFVLFYIGNLNLLNDEIVGVVGSRKCDNYGSTTTKMIVKELVEMNMVIISGVANGIDAIAHAETLNYDGKTIGVLGCGLDIIYPKSNKFIYEEIKNKGLLISEFLPTTKPFKWNFPFRNRIISGLCDKLIIIEATINSGSLITVNHALDQGKDIMAVPGSIFNDLSKGCNRIIQEGAKSFNEVNDLYVFFNKIRKPQKKLNNNLKVRILEFVTKDPVHLDVIIDNVNIDRVALFELLFEMQNRKEIICLPGNYYAKLS